MSLVIRPAARWAAAEERLTHKPLPVVRLRSAERVNLDYTPTEVEALAAEISGKQFLRINREAVSVFSRQIAQDLARANKSIADAERCSTDDACIYFE